MQICNDCRHYWTIFVFQSDVKKDFFNDIEHFWTFLSHLFDDFSASDIRIAKIVTPPHSGQNLTLWNAIRNICWHYDFCETQIGLYNCYWKWRKKCHQVYLDELVQPNNVIFIFIIHQVTQKNIFLCNWTPYRFLKWLSSCISWNASQNVSARSWRTRWEWLSSVCIQNNAYIVKTVWFRLPLFSIRASVVVRSIYFVGAIIVDNNIQTAPTVLPKEDLLQNVSTDSIYPQDPHIYLFFYILRHTLTFYVRIWHFTSGFDILRQDLTFYVKILRFTSGFDILRQDFTFYVWNLTSDSEIRHLTLKFNIWQ